MIVINLDPTTWDNGTILLVCLFLFMFLVVALIKWIVNHYATSQKWHF